MTNKNYMANTAYKPSEIEPKWQKKWEESRQNVVDISGAKRPFYNLMMFPYPSAEGLHVGNMYAFTAADIYGRFKRLQGFDVFEPIGLDGFGIHSENYALKIGRHPKEHAAMTEKNFYAQLHKIGCMYDWTRTVETYNPNYYKWTQWVFVQMFKAGLAYRGKAKVNWCPKCKTVLSDEQVINGKCERTGDEVIKKETEQWFFKITDYADRLLANLNKLNWTEKIKTTQRNWIGRKEWIDITYPIDESSETIVVSTTRPDTNFGATFIVISPEHPIVEKITESGQKEAVEAYVEVAKKKSDEERVAEGRKKTGVFTGAYAINQLNGKKLPIWVADFVLMSVGTGAVVGVPGHDRRDFEFAKEFGLPVVRVVVGKDGDTSDISDPKQVQEDQGTMVNSGFLDGLTINVAIGKMRDYLEEKGWGKQTVRYHLRDWLVSRQRYWGAPIPMISCQKCGWQAVPEKDLPVLLPDISDYQPEGTGKGPLAKHPEFYKTSCPKCGGEAQRETDVCDTFLDSAWYELRYPSVGYQSQKSKVKSQNLPWDPGVTKKWLPVDMYTGGAEHAVLHLMYFRFVTMVLHDLGYLDFDEPAKSFFAHGLLISEGAKMSKSRGNVVNPDEYIARYGADALRLYLMFMGPVDQGGDFRDSGMVGMRRFVEKVWKVIGEVMDQDVKESKPAVKWRLAELVGIVGADLESRRYNTAIAKMMEFINLLASDLHTLTREDLGVFVQVLASFAPHLAEELWERLGNEESVHKQPWPEVEGQVENGPVTVVVSINGKPRGTIDLSSDNAKVIEQDEIVRIVQTTESIVKYLNVNAIKRVVYVPGKIINFVV